MLKKLRDLLQEFSAYLSFWPLFGGTAVMSAVTGLAAWATKQLEEWAPLSYLVAAVAGAIVFVAIFGAAVVIRNAMIMGSIRRRFYEGGERIDPMKRQFDRQRVKIADLAPPMGGPIKEKTFEECEILGPANIVLLGTGSSMLAGNTFSKTDAISTADGAQPNTAVIFLNCRFINCHFFEVAIFLHEGVYDAANTAISGLNWITPPPSTLFSPTQPQP